MVVKEIKYTDFNGVERSEKFYFHFSQTELMEMELSEETRLSTRLQEIAESNDPAKILEKFKWIVRHAYGEKSEDGRRFVKSKELSDAFFETPAYEELLFSLASDTEAMIAFTNGIVPELDERLVPKNSK